MKVQSYLMFNGRTEEALKFYEKALGAKVEMIMRYKDAPAEAQCPPHMGEKVMHSAFVIGDTRLMATDGAEAKRRFGVSWMVMAGPKNP